MPKKLEANTHFEYTVLSIAKKQVCGYPFHESIPKGGTAALLFPRRHYMRISVITNGRSNGSVVCERYEEGKFLLIYETDNNTILKVYPAYEKDPLFFAKKTVAHDCEALVCGIMQKPEFEMIAEAGITRYNGSGLGALIALRAAVPCRYSFIFSKLRIFCPSYNRTASAVRLPVVCLLSSDR